MTICLFEKIKNVFQFQFVIAHVLILPKYASEYIYGSWELFADVIHNQEKINSNHWNCSIGLV